MKVLTLFQEESIYKLLSQEAIKKLKYDIPYTGHVTGTTPFGIFVEFNECLTGMIHKA